MSTVHSHPEPVQPETSFEVETGALGAALAQALRTVLNSLPITEKGCLSVGNFLGVDKNIIWKLSRAATAGHPAEVLSWLPGRNGMRMFVDHARARGGDPAALDAIVRGFDAFERLVIVHAGKRNTFDAMARALADFSDTAQPPDETPFREAFSSASTIWGAQAKAQIAVHLLAPSATPGALDIAVAEGLIGFQRLRPANPWCVAAPQEVGAARPADWRHLESPHGRDLRPPLLDDFCSGPPVSLRTEHSASGTPRCIAGDGPLGATGTSTVLAGWIRSGVPASPAARVRAVVLGTPSETFVFDVLVHRDLPLDGAASAHFLDRLFGCPNPLTDAPSAPLRSLASRPAHLHSLFDLETRCWSRHTELASFLAAALGHPLDHFRAVRFAVAFPPLPTTAVFRC